MPTSKIISLTTLMVVLSTLFLGCKKDPAIIDEQKTVYNYDFTWGSEYPNAQSLVFFKAVNVPTDAPLTWFVNGTPYKTNDFQYRFPKGGKYIVKMVVNNDDNQSVTKEVTVVPASVHTEYKGVRVVGDTIYFTSLRSDGGKHLWDFGDGNTSTENDPYHIYTAAGDYTVKLTVTELEEQPMTSALALTIVADPVHTSKIATNRTWEVTPTHFSLPLNSSTTTKTLTEQFALLYINKLEVGFPIDNFLNGSISYNAKASSGNLLVFTRDFGISADTLIYDHVADTIYCKGTVWNVPPGQKSTDGTGTTYVMRAQ